MDIINKLSYAEIFSILGKFVFETFNQSCYRTIEFDRYITDNVQSTESKLYMISTLLNSGLFIVRDTISFSHKLFKEYFAAYYLIREYPLSDSLDIYKQLVANESWQEVLIFSAGMFDSITEQDAFLDFIMHTNLKLYVECVNAKSDLSNSISTLSQNDYAKRYLKLLRDTYAFIINKYFNPIRNIFDPVCSNSEDKIIQITGSISDDGKLLDFWFDKVDENQPQVLAISGDELSEKYKQFEHKEMLERQVFKTYGVNLSLSNLIGDSARKVALDKAKNEIKHIIEKRQLIESNYLLCERVEAIKQKLKDIKTYNDLNQMYQIISEKVVTAKARTHNLISINHNGINLMYLLRILTSLIGRNIDYNDCLLPGEDIQPSQESCWIWDGYSDNQRETRTSKFFYFHQLSYIQMANANFPLLANYFSKYLDTPYQNIVHLYRNEITDDTLIHSYHIASDTDFPKEPQIINLPADPFKNHTRIFEEIRNSYLKKEKVAHELKHSGTSFSSLFYSKRTGAPFPLSDYVCDSIKDSLEEIFGK